MWSKPSFDPKEHAAENAVLDAVSSAVVSHLRRAALESVDGDPSPALIQVDGPGRTECLEKLEEKLDPVAPRRTTTKTESPPAHTESEPEPWTAIWFDAW